MKISKTNAKQLGWAAVGVLAGIVLYNNLSKVLGSTVVGKALSGDLVRSA